MQERYRNLIEREIVVNGNQCNSKVEKVAIKTSLLDVKFIALSICGEVYYRTSVLDLNLLQSKEIPAIFARGKGNYRQLNDLCFMLYIITCFLKLAYLCFVAKF